MLAPCAFPISRQLFPGLTYTQGTSTVSTTGPRQCRQLTPQQHEHQALACSDRYHGVMMALTSSSILLQSFGVPFSLQLWAAREATIPWACLDLVPRAADHAPTNQAAR